MTLSSRFLNLPFIRRRQPVLAEIESLLDLFPAPTLLLDLHARKVLLANARVTELTAFTRTELANLALSSLFLDTSQLDLLLEPENIPSEFQTAITTHQGIKVFVLVTLHRLDSSGSWVLASLEPLELHLQNKADRQRHAHLFTDLHTLMQAIQEEDVDLAIQTVLQLTHSLTGASAAAVYQADPQNPAFHRIAVWGAGTRLPDLVQPVELGPTLEPHLWSSKKRATTGLQRAARLAGFVYMASAPLGQPETLSGVLVIADPDSPAPKEVLSLLRIIASTLTIIVDLHIKEANRLEIQNNQLHTIKIAETIRESVQEGIILVSPDFLIQEMNPSAEWLLGYASREVQGQPVENVIIGADNLIQALQTAQQGIITHNLGYVHLHRRDGGAFLAHIQTLPVPTSENQTGIIILVRDLSEHEQFQIRSQQLEQRALLGEITAIFAHEVRNPINNISTGLQLMAMNLPPDDPNQELISRLGHDCNRLAHLMQSVLSFSRPIENKLNSLDLGVLVERLLERWRPRLARVNVQHHFQNKAKNTKLIGDPRALEQVFTNLISNAVQVMSETGGTLAINIRNLPSTGEHEQLEITVSDNGPGVPEEIRDRIFEPFFTTNANGTGLGLAISKRIITAHKGTISVNSVPGGTVFQIILPAIEEVKLE